MSTASKSAQPILEMSAESMPDYEHQLKLAKTQLEELQAQREELERQRRHAEALQQQREQFVSAHIDITERMESSLQGIERELFEIHRETKDLEETRSSFAKHLERLQRLNIEDWSPEQMEKNLPKAMTIVETAEGDYDEAAARFAQSRSRGAFRGSSGGRGSSTEFHTNLMNGLAFNLPTIILGGLALIVFLFK